MKSASNGPQASRRGLVLEGLARLNKEVSTWAASMSWWRLLALFLVILMAAAIVGDQLGLKHRRVVVQGRETVSIGPDGIHVTRKGPSADADPDGDQLPPVPPVPPPKPQRSAASAQPAASAGAKGPIRFSNGTLIVEDDPDGEPQVRRVFTVQGLVGDLGATLITLLFAYLVASKILVRKVAESDAKVRSAEDAASREAMERQLVQARVQVLQAQVEPHFLFNTLAAVDYLIETDPPRASHMQKSLIAYLRSALPQMRQHSSTLGREVSLVRAYLELIRMRIEERLEFRIEVPPGLESAEFPPMMLQTIVENAIKHGIEPKPEGGSVTVSARIADGRLCVEVRDTGVGIVDMETLRGPTSGTGLGLQNIRERLAMLYPGKSRLALWSDDAVGTRVQIDIPYIVAQSPAREGTADDRR